MRYSFLEPARHELEEAIESYDGDRRGLGDELAEEAESTIQRILAYPRTWHPLSPRTRRCRTRRFPYGLIYQLRDDLILIVACMHMRRKPGRAGGGGARGRSG